MRGEAGLYRRRVTPPRRPALAGSNLYGRGNRSCVPPKDTAGLPAVFPQHTHSYKPTSEFGGPLRPEATRGAA